MRKIIILLGLCLITKGVFAQKTPEGALNIGDLIPDITLKNLVNSSERTAKLSDYKGKLIILDFWFSHCVPCIAALPHMQELQNKLKDKIKIIFITVDKGDNEEKILSTFKGINKRTGINITIPSSLYNSEINNLFPNKSQPYEVWIDPSGKIVAFTDADQVTETHINDALSGKTSNIKMRYDFTNQSKPLVHSEKIRNDSLILFQSLITKYRNGLTPNSNPKFDKNGKMIGYSFINWNLFGMYQMAYPKEFTKGNVIYETKDSLLFKHVDLRKDYDKTFCYDLYIPGGCSIDEIQAILKEDLERTFNYAIRNQKRTLPCLIIRTNKNIEKLVTKGGERDQNLNEYELAIKNRKQVYYHNGALNNALIYFIYRKFNPITYLVETDFKQNIDLDFPIGFNFNNTALLKSFLHDKGIDLSWENRELDVVVIDDKKSDERTVNH